MKTIKLIGSVDEQHRLCAVVPDNVPPGPVKVLLVLSSGKEEDEADAWMEGIARAWAAELRDPREDIYTLSDGEPVDGAR